MMHVDRSKIPARRRASLGFSIMEVLVASVVSLLVVLAIMAFFDSQQRAYATMTTYSQSQNVTRTAIDLMSREIRMSSFDPTDVALVDSPGPTCPTVKQGLVIAMPSLIRFQQDLDGDGLLVSPAEDVAYGQSADQLMRWDLGVGTPGIPLVTGLRPNDGLQFQYFDGENPPNEIVPSGSPPTVAPDPRACIEKVLIRIRADIANPHPSQPSLKSVVETGVAIRNRSLAKF